jgi:DNA-3-methyladenine glycosylase II
VLRGLIEQYGELSMDLRRRIRALGEYGALLRAIVGQQLSTKAAESIFGRLLDLFGGEVPSPRQILDADPEQLRAVGLSRAKVAYLRDLAAHVEDGDLELDRLTELSDEEVIQQLTAVKGLGQWSADMFLMFELGRPDVLPVGDLGIRRAVQRLYGLPKIPAPAEIMRIAEPWRPYRTLASLYLWTSLRREPL